MELKGKTVNFLGDSLTEGIGVSDRPNNRYDNVFAKEMELAKVNNYGYGGTRIAHQQHSTPNNPWFDLNFCGRALWMDKKADAVVVFGGVNDYLHGDAPVGQPGDKTPETFCGAVWFLMNELRQNYKDKPIVFMTPNYCYFREVSDATPTHDARKHGVVSVLSEYVSVIEETAKEFSIPVLNLQKELGINPNMASDREQYTVDGLHFNDIGSRKLGLCLAEFFKQL